MFNNCEESTRGFEGLISFWKCPWTEISKMGLLLQVAEKFKENSTIMLIIKKWETWIFLMLVKTETPRAGKLKKLNPKPSPK